jgi:hypothetical protein
MRSAVVQPTTCGLLWNGLLSSGCLARYARDLVHGHADLLERASRTRRWAAWRALNSIICTRLYTLTAPSPVVSIGRKMALGVLLGHERLHAVRHAERACSRTA